MITAVTILDFITTTHISRSVSDQYNFGIGIGRYGKSLTVLLIGIGQ